jgi:hypothetical protein
MSAIAMQRCNDNRRVGGMDGHVVKTLCCQG